MQKHAARAHDGKQQEPICHGDRPYDLSNPPVGAAPTNAAAMKSGITDSQSQSAKAFKITAFLHSSAKRHLGS